MQDHAGVRDTGVGASRTWRRPRCGSAHIGGKGHTAKSRRMSQSVEEPYQRAERIRNVEEKRGVSGVGDSDGGGGDRLGRYLGASSQVVYLVALVQLEFALVTVHLVRACCNVSASALQRSSAQVANRITCCTIAKAEEPLRHSN